MNQWSVDALTGNAYARALMGALQAIEAQTRNVSELIACPRCRARITEACRTSTGQRRADHSCRLVSRRCPCGGLLAKWHQLCDRCRVEHKRRATREASVRLRARRREAA